LNDAEQALLCRASVFSGGWTRDAAERVCTGGAVDAENLVDVLTSLVDKNLVLAQAQHGATRYGMLETVRHYATDRLRERGGDTNLARRHLDYMLALAQDAEPRLIGEEPHVWFERLEIEHDNFRAALAWSCGADGNPVDGLRLASLLGRFWGERGHLVEGRRWISSLIAAAPGEHADGARANALRQEGILARAQADYSAARKLLAGALAIFRTLGDRRGIGQALNSLASSAIDEGDFPLAQLLLEESLAITKELGDHRWTGVVLANLGVVAMQVGKGLIARDLFEESLAIQRTAGDRGANAIATHNFGLLLREQGDYVRAEALLKESLFTWHARGNHAYIASSLEGLAALALALAQPIRAARLWGRAAAIRDETGAALPQWVRSRFNRDVAAARIAVGDEPAFDRAWAEGRDMTQEYVTKYLLDFGAIG
jgi:tetratricopeptide (TPR) repeat protein